MTLEKGSVPGIPYGELPAAVPGEVFFAEWNAYLLEIGGLLAAGLEGKHVVIKGNEIIGVHDTWKAAREAGLKRFLDAPFFVHPIRAEEPYVRLPGISYRCPRQ